MQLENIKLFGHSVSSVLKLGCENWKTPQKTMHAINVS